MEPAALIKQFLIHDDNDELTSNPRADRYYNLFMIYDVLNNNEVH